MSNNNSVTLPPGRYYVGDPCYVFNMRNWDKLLDKTDFFEQASCVLPNREGQMVSVAAFDTLFGDGHFDGFDVDSGLIGCVHESLIDADSTIGTETVVGHQFINMTEPFEVFRDENMIHIGNIAIDTSPEEEEDEIWDDEDDDFVDMDDYLPEDEDDLWDDEEQY